MALITSFFTSPIEYLKKMLLEKWAGRGIIMLMTLVGGYLGQTAIDPAIIENWVQATGELLTALVPLLLAWILGMARQKTALTALPPPETKTKLVLKTTSPASSFS